VEEKKSMFSDSSSVATFDKEGVTLTSIIFDHPMVIKTKAK